MNYHKSRSLLMLILLAHALALGGKPAARLGDMTMHGGSVVLGFPMVLIGGMPAARLGDMHVCPMLTPGIPPMPHVGGPITLGSPMVLIGGMPAARMGDMCVCAGPPDCIALGCPTVLIGEGGSGGTSAGTTGFVKFSRARVRIKDAQGGEFLWDHGNITNSLTGSHLVFDECEGEDCPLLGVSLFPGEYSVSVSDYEDGIARVAFYKDSVAFVYEREGATSDQVDELSIGTAFQVTSQSAAPGGIKFTVYYATPTEEKMVELETSAIVDGETIQLQAAEDNQLHILNLGSSMAYTLKTGSWKGETYQEESVSNLSAPSQSQQVLAPRWDAFGLYPTKIQIDTDLNGIFDVVRYVSPLTSAEQISNALTFFDQAVSSGTLTGSGPGKSAPGRLNALRNMLESSSSMIDADQMTDASLQLRDAYLKADGNADPPDFVIGAARTDLARMLDNLIKTMNCNAIGKIPPALPEETEHPKEIPTTLELLPNFPNPFNPTTTIRYALPERTHVCLTIFSTTGEKIADLVKGEMEAGHHEVLFDASGLASGIYFYRLTAGEHVQTRKMVLTR